MKRKVLSAVGLVALLAAGLTTAMLLLAPAAGTASATIPAGAVVWTGQGTTDGSLDTVLCDENSTPYLLWIFTLGGQNSVTNAVLTVNGDTYTGTQFGNEIHFTTPFYATNTTDTQAYVTFDGATGKNPNLVISHGCPGETTTTTTDTTPTTTTGETTTVTVPTTVTTPGTTVTTPGTTVTTPGTTVTTPGTTVTTPGATTTVTTTTNNAPPPKPKHHNNKAPAPQKKLAFTP